MDGGDGSPTMQMQSMPLKCIFKFAVVNVCLCVFKFAVVNN